MENDLKTHLQSFTAIAEACHRKVEPSYSWHILDWIAYKARYRWSLVCKNDQIINNDYGGT